MTQLNEKYEDLKRALAALKRVVIAFSGGVDSTFLLFAAKEALGDGAIAVTCTSNAFPRRETDEAAAFCRDHGIEQHVLCEDIFRIEGFAQNPKDRCYICKRALFRGFVELAEELGANAVAEGSNLDDEGDYRPGLKAIAELGIKSPLREYGFTKAEIRELSAILKLPTWNKPSYACLASRFPYGETITPEKLGMVELAEQTLTDMGFSQRRVRIHGNVARIELPPEDMPRILQEDLRGDIYRRFKTIGFDYTALDLLGYRSGSMNETLSAGGKAGES